MADPISWPNQEVIAAVDSPEINEHQTVKYLEVVLRADQIDLIVQAVIDKLKEAE